MKSKGVEPDAYTLEEGDWITALIDGRERKGIVLNTLEDAQGYGIVIQTAADRELIIGPEHVVSRM